MVISPGFTALEDCACAAKRETKQKEKARNNFFITSKFSGLKNVIDQRCKEGIVNQRRFFVLFYQTNWRIKNKKSTKQAGY